MNSIEHLVQRISRGPKARSKFVASHLDKGIAYQIRALRDRQDLSQEKLAEMVGMNQNAISRLESPERGRPTITTLKRLAEAFDVALVVRFVPFSKLAKWISGTPYVEEGMSPEALGVPSFGEEDKRAFTPPAYNRQAVQPALISLVSDCEQEGLVFATNIAPQQISRNLTVSIPVSQFIPFDQLLRVENPNSVISLQLPKFKTEASTQ